MVNFRASALMLMERGCEFIGLVTQASIWQACDEPVVREVFLDCRQMSSCTFLPRFRVCAEDVHAFIFVRQWNLCISLAK